MTRVVKRGLFVLCGVLLADANSREQEPIVYEWPTEKPASVKAFADEIDGYLLAQETKGFSGVVLVAERGKVLLHKAYGHADKENGRRMTTETGFDIGSIVKPMTKAGIVKLDSEGKISLSDKLSKHFENVPPDKAEITLQHVVDHTAGFPDIFGDDYATATRDWVVEKTLTADLVSKPGETFNYSNAGYSVLGAIIEKVSGNPYERYVYDEILSPAGVKRIGYLIPGWKKEELAVGYYEGKRWGTPLDHAWMEDGPSWNLRANGGMLSTVEELYRWFDGVISGTVLSKEATEKYRGMMFRAGRMGDRVIGTAGGNGIFNSLYINVDDIGLVFVLFTAQSDWKAEEVSRPLRSRLMGLAGKG
jgi:CubicO group peptidase (beta-lactamase class C family)